MATDIKQQADLAAVIMQQGQQATAKVCLVTGHMTVVRAKIEQSILGNDLAAVAIQKRWNVSTKIYCNRFYVISSLHHMTKLTNPS